MPQLQCPSCGLRLDAAAAPLACPRCMIRRRGRFELVARPAQMVRTAAAGEPGRSRPRPG